MLKKVYLYLFIVFCLIFSIFTVSFGKYEDQILAGKNIYLKDWINVIEAPWEKEKGKRKGKKEKEEKGKKKKKEKRNWIFRIWGYNETSERDLRNLWLYWEGKAHLGSYKGSKLVIYCKNGRIKVVWTTYITGCGMSVWKPITWYNEKLCYTKDLDLDKVIIAYQSWGWDENKVIWTVTAYCIAPQNVNKVLSSVWMKEYDVVSKDFEVLAKSFDDWKIDEEDLKDFQKGKAVEYQPNFVDILYLQLKIISNLYDSIQTLNSWMDFSSIFQPGQYSRYTDWIEKFTYNNNLQDFRDSFSGSVTLKDIGIAQDIIVGLTKCLNDILSWAISCNGYIRIKHSPLDKFSFYRLVDIVKQIYDSWTDTGLLVDSIKLYNKSANICGEENINSIEDKNLKDIVKKYCVKLYSQLSDEDLADDYNIGYYIASRVENLNQLITGFLNPENVNMLWIFNFYYELNNLIKGIKKTIIIKEIKTEWVDVINIINKIILEDTINKKDVSVSLSTQEKVANKYSYSDIVTWIENAINRSIEDSPSISEIKDEDCRVYIWPFQFLCKRYEVDFKVIYTIFSNCHWERIWLWRFKVCEDLQKVIYICNWNCKYIDSFKICIFDNLSCSIEN